VGRSSRVFNTIGVGIVEIPKNPPPGTEHVFPTHEGLACCWSGDAEPCGAICDPGGPVGFQGEAGGGFWDVPAAAGEEWRWLKAERGKNRQQEMSVSLQFIQEALQRRGMVIGVLYRFHGRDWVRESGKLPFRIFGMRADILDESLCKMGPRENRPHLWPPVLRTRGCGGGCEGLVTGSAKTQLPPLMRILFYFATGDFSGLVIDDPHGGLAFPGDARDGVITIGLRREFYVPSN
jgi:hypothetical protein